MHLTVHADKERRGILNQVAGIITEYIYGFYGQGINAWS
jgi:hypothetical protein